VALPQGQNPHSTSQPASTAGSKTKTKGTIGHGRQGRPSKQSDYTPRITLAKGANPALRKGPDERLLLTTYGAWEGPDPYLRKGPQRSNARGPNPLNRRR